MVREGIAGVSLAIRVQPGASKSGPVGVYGEEGAEIKWALFAHPTDGQANKELIQNISKVFGVSKSRVAIVRGESARSKQIFVEGISESSASEILKDVL